MGRLVSKVCNLIIATFLTLWPDFAIVGAAPLVGMVSAILEPATSSDQSVLSNVYQLAVLIPSISVGCRRMHDTGRSGWWLLVPIVSLIFLVEEGTKGGNKFGPNPWAKMADTVH